MFPTLKAKYPKLDFSSTRWAGSAKPRYGQYTLEFANDIDKAIYICLLYTSPSPRDKSSSRMPSSA